MKLRLILTSIGAAICGMLGAQNDLSAEECNAMIKKHGKKLQIVDVRTPAEYEQGHIEGAKLIDWRSGNFNTEACKKLKKKKAVLVYCRSGTRSAAAAKALKELNFNDVYNMKGGYLSWVKTQK